jgi:hypothetical protein
MRESYNDTTLGMIKAMGFLAEGRPNKPNNRFVDEPGPRVPHGLKRLPHEERKAAIDLMYRVHEDEVSDKEKTTILARLFREFNIRFVPTRSRRLIDTSRYTGERLQAIARSGGGPREQARAMRRFNDITAAVA